MTINVTKEKWRWSFCKALIVVMRFLSVKLSSWKFNRWTFHSSSTMRHFGHICSTFHRDWNEHAFISQPNYYFLRRRRGIGTKSACDMPIANSKIIKSPHEPQDDPVLSSL